MVVGGSTITPFRKPPLICTWLLASALCFSIMHTVADWHAFELSASQCTYSGNQSAWRTWAQKCHAKMFRNSMKQAANQSIQIYHSEKFEEDHLSVEAYSLLGTKKSDGALLESNPSDWSRALSWISNVIKTKNLIKMDFWSRST